MLTSSENLSACSLKEKQQNRKKKEGMNEVESSECMKTRIFLLDVAGRKEGGEDEINHYFDGTVNKKQSKRCI